MKPSHIAIIMDGNRRWARQRNLPIVMGHREGIKRVQDIVHRAHTLGIKHLTFWAFSTENWKRETQEVSDLMGVFRRAFTKSALKEIINEGAKINIFGDLSKFPPDIQENINELVEDTKNNTEITVNIALNYGGREEIVRGINHIIKDKLKKVDKNIFSSYLYSHGQPDPDLIIRVGGEKRLSGYLLWQIEYSELYFTDTLWPDFDGKEFDKALDDYFSRNRRFGI